VAEWRLNPFIAQAAGAKLSAVTSPFDRPRDRGEKMGADITVRALLCFWAIGSVAAAGGRSRRRCVGREAARAQQCVDVRIAAAELATRLLPKIVGRR
jgi:hypothetical protein